MANKNNGTVIAATREIAESKVGLEALARAGRNPQLKGVVHEVAVKNLYNAAPQRILDGTKAVLSKSPTAVRDDLLIMKGSNVVGRMQLKDTAGSIQKTIAQVKDGHYAGTVLKGTKETVSAYNTAVQKAASSGTNITQKMTSTGISSSDTARIATKTIGNAAGKSRHSPSAVLRHPPVQQAQSSPVELKRYPLPSSLPTAKSTAENSPPMSQKKRLAAVSPLLAEVLPPRLPLPVLQRFLRRQPHRHGFRLPSVLERR